MKRHPFNIFSLIFGIALVLLAAWTTWVAFPVSDRFILDFSRWLVPAAAILVGAALLSPLRNAKASRETSGDETGSEPSGVETDTLAEHS